MSEGGDLLAKRSTRFAISAQEADEMGLRDAELGGEVVGGTVACQPEEAEAVETVGVVVEVDGSRRRKREEGLCGFEPKVARVPRLRFLRLAALAQDLRCATTGSTLRWGFAPRGGREWQR